MSADRNKPTVAQNITDETWLELKQLSGLPDDARGGVERIVLFVLERPPLKHPLVTELQVSRKNLRKAVECLDCAAASLTALIECGAHYVFQPLAIRPSNDAFAVSTPWEIERLRDQMVELVSNLKYSERRLKYAPPGRHKEHLPMAVRFLDELLIERTGRPLDQKKRSKDGIDLSRFALQVLRLGDPSLTGTGIQNLIRRQQTARTGSAPRRRTKRRSK
jgi:hypothetical protein